jgi:hypothetical protein
MAAVQVLAGTTTGWWVSTREAEEIRHVPVVCWMNVGGPSGVVPMAPVGGASVATSIKNPYGDSTLLWHQDAMTREQAEQELMARVGGGG